MHCERLMVKHVYESREKDLCITMRRTYETNLSQKINDQDIFSLKHKFKEPIVCITLLILL